MHPGTINDKDDGDDDEDDDDEHGRRLVILVHLFFVVIRLIIANCLRVVFMIKEQVSVLRPLGRILWLTKERFETSRPDNKTVILAGVSPWAGSLRNLSNDRQTPPCFFPNKALPYGVYLC